MTARAVKGLSCPSCAGSVEVVEGARLAGCEACGAALLVQGERGAARFYVPLRQTREQILGLVQKWWGGLAMAPDLARNARVRESFAVYAPFWRAAAQVVGIVLGDEKKGSGKNERWEPVERRVNERFELTVPACELGELGVLRIDLRGDELRPFELEEVQRQGMTFGVLSTAQAISRQAAERFPEMALRRARVDRVRFKRIDVLTPSIDIVYYPLWVLRYEYRKRLYQVTADGESGELLYGRAPGNDLFRVAALVGSLMLGNFVLTTACRVTLAGDADRAIFGALAVAAFVVFWGYRRFRYGGEVTIGGPWRGRFQDRVGELSREAESIVRKLKL
jgi:hypothetical protein